MDEQMVSEFNSACEAYEELKANQAQLQKDLKMVDPEVITMAKPPADKKERLRSSDRSTLKSTSDKGSPRSLGSVRAGEAAAGAAQAAPEQEGLGQNFERAGDQELELISGEEELRVNEAGMQLLQHNLTLTFQQKLQLRIANERGINIDNLMDSQYKVLKDYKKLETNQDMMNNMQDFLAPEADQ